MSRILTYKKLFQVSLTGSGTQDSLYTPGSGNEAIVKHIRVVNYTGSVATIEIWQGGTADSNLIQPTTNVGANDVLEIHAPIAIEGTDQLYAEGSAASTFTVTGYGVEIT